MSSHNPIQSSDRDALKLPIRAGRYERSTSDLQSKVRPSGVSLGTYQAQPGSFNPDIKSSFKPDLKSTIIARGGTGRPDTPTFTSLRSQRMEQRDDTNADSEKRQADLREKIEKELKIKVGSENLLEALNAKSAKQARDQRIKVEAELNATNQKIAQLRFDLHAEVERSKEPSPSRLAQLFQSPLRSPSHHEDEDPFEREEESPTFALAELLHDLEAEGHASEYYVERANSLTDLFKRDPTLKYDLVWSIFGTRLQTLLLSDSREVVAASYRVLRHVITDRKSISIIRSLEIDYLVMLSLVKESKASVEREQALKLIRAFADVKDGTKEISRGIIRVIGAVSQHSDDRIRSMCVLTLAELVIRDPELVASAGGLYILSEAFADQDSPSSEGLIHSFLYLADLPSRRRLLSDGGAELDSPFAIFTDATFTSTQETLTAAAAAIATLFKSWLGLFMLSRHRFAAVRSLMSSLQMPSSMVRGIILELINDILRIKPPSWSTSFLAGRRLTTYGRVAALSEAVDSERVRTYGKKDELVEHFKAAVLAVLVHSGLLEMLLSCIQSEEDGGVKRKATLLLGEILNLAHDCLPNTWSLKMQLLPTLFEAATTHGEEERHVASSAVYQIDSVNRTLHRSGKASASLDSIPTPVTRPNRTLSDLSRTELTPQVDETHFRAAITETGVLSSVNFSKWRWDIIQKLIEGPLLNPKRLEEATKANKFVKRLIGFYRPFKYRFSEVRNTKPAQRYVRVGCALLKTLLGSPDGVKYLLENKLLRQIAECLAQVDRLSGLTSAAPLFSRERLVDTLSGGYFAMLGVISSTQSGLAMMERWKMVNMFYHIVELTDRDDLIKAMLGAMDYTLDSPLRVIHSKAMTSCSLEVKVFATRQLRKYAIGGQSTARGRIAEPARWAIELLVTQLYDPEVEVCEIAIRILEEACNDEASLEFVVQCRPVLDHLAEIGAPLLLRFLSSSTGYHYLDGLDYISQEMDDWFLGRNDAYVTLVEASLAKVSSTSHDRLATHPEQDDLQEPTTSGSAPPHFYRELTRTAEGCRLLQEKGHFQEFVTIIREHGMESSDQQAMLKVKGAMWAVGNIGSMELGAPMLESSDAVELIVDIAEHSEVLSMRGTAFFVLGLVSRSIHGQEILAERGWDFAIDEMGQPHGICLPSNLFKLFALPEHAIPSAKRPTDQEVKDHAAVKAALTDTDSTNAEILRLINDLGNSVLTKPRAAELHAIKSKKPPGFQSTELFKKVMTIVEQRHFRLPVLRFIFDLFDRNVLRRIVLEESESDGEQDTIIGNHP